MFKFAYPGILFLLLALPLVGILFFINRRIRRHRLSKFGNPKLVGLLMPNRSKYEAGLRLAIFLVGLASIIFALARPWGGIRNQDTTREGVEIVIAVDASNSMLASATEDEGGLDRMRTSKLFLEKLINRLSNDRVGLIAYAGEAYTLIPVTNDYVSAKTFLNSIDPAQIPYQGTNIGAAIRLATKSFSEGTDTGKAIILLTDADELEDPQGTLEAVEEAAKLGIQTDVIGIGSSPVTIPSDTQGRMIDKETGEVVKTALNEDLALAIAEDGNGIYVNASNGDALDELMKQVGKLKKSALESSFMVSHDELYIIFVIIALVALIIDCFLTDKKNILIDRLSLFRKHKAFVIGLIIIPAFAVSCAKRDNSITSAEDMTDVHSRNDSLLSIYSLPEEKEYIETGNRQFMGGELQEADSSYVDALNVNPSSVVASLNDGLANMYAAIQLQESMGEEKNDSILIPFVEKAKEMWRNASAPLVEKKNISSLAFYNMGNLAFIQENWQEAIDAYKDALRLNPDDSHARRNLRIAQLQKNEQDQNQNQQQNQQQQQDQQQDQQQNQQQQQDPRNINEQTSQQILDASERKENQRRIQMQLKNNENSVRRTNKNW